MPNLKFKPSEVGRLIDHTNANPEMRTLYGEPVTEPSLWLVGDHGVYLMSGSVVNKPPANEAPDTHKTDVVYAVNCNPQTMSFDDWWKVKGATFGGDDGIVPISVADFETTEFPVDYIEILFTPDTVQVRLVGEEVIRNN